MFRRPQPPQPSPSNSTPGSTPGARAFLSRATSCRPPVRQSAVKLAPPKHPGCQAGRSEQVQFRSPFLRRLLHLVLLSLRPTHGHLIKISVLPSRPPSFKHSLPTESFPIRISLPHSFGTANFNRTSARDQQPANHFFPSEPYDLDTPPLGTALQLNLSGRTQRYVCGVVGFWNFMPGRDPD